MKILYNLRHKGKIILLLTGLAFLEILSSNNHNQSISDMGDSFSEVYADRLVVQDYIYKLADNIHQRKLMLATETDDEKMAQLFKTHALQTSVLITKYEKTKLTDKEKLIFDTFKKNARLSIALEQNYLRIKSHTPGKTILLAHQQVMDASLKQLNELSEIQIAQGKSLNEASKKIVSFSTLVNQFDWALILIIVVMIQAFIFAAKSIVPKTAQNQYLN